MSANATPQRIIEPEILDELSSSDPRAIRARNDLKRVNFWMGHAAIFSKTLGRFCDTPPRRIVELGAGDGTLLLKIAARFPAWNNVTATLIDREPAVSEHTLQNFKTLGWKANVLRADIFEWAKTGDNSDIVLANLFLHHFDETRLRDLFAKISDRTRLFVACEPRRTRFAPLARRLLWLIGCTDLTRHDAAVSIRAGFVGQELSPLWPAQRGWRLSEGNAGFFSHLFVAQHGQAKA